MNEEESKNQRIIENNGDTPQNSSNLNLHKIQEDQQQDISQKESQIKKEQMNLSERSATVYNKIIHNSNSNNSHVDYQQVFNTEGNQRRIKQERRYSYLSKTPNSQIQQDDSHLKPPKNEKGKVEYDKVKDFLVKTYTDQCEEDAQMELISMPSKRSNYKKKGKKTPIRVQNLYQEAQQKKQLNDVFQFTIVDNKKKRQEIKLRQRLVREYSIDSHTLITEESKENQLSQYDSAPLNQIKQKSQSFYLDNKHDISQANLNAANIQTIHEEPDIIMIEDSYPLEWDPGFNKKARKKLDLINQARSNNTLPILDLSNTKNVEKYRHILNSKQGWQPLLNTPFLPVSPQNQLKKADFFKNLLKEQKHKFHKSRTPVKSRVRERQNNLQNKWGEYYLQNQTSIDIDPQNILVLNKQEKEQQTVQTVPSELSLIQKQQQIQSMYSSTNKYTINRARNLKDLPSKVTEVEENSLCSSVKPLQSQLTRTQDYDKDQGNIEEINQRIGQMMQKIPQKREINQYNQSQKITPLRQQSRVQTANIKQFGNRRISRYNSNENQTISNFYQTKEDSIFDKKSSQNFYNHNLNVSRSHDFYSKNSLSSNKLIVSRDCLNEISIAKDQQNKYNTLSYSTINQQGEEQNLKIENSLNNHQDSRESFFVKQESISKNKINQEEQPKRQEKNILIYEKNNGNNSQENNDQNIQNTVRFQNKGVLKRKINFTNKPLYITYQHQKMNTEGNIIEYENPDLKETIRVQEMMIQEQKLKQQLSILRSQGDRASKLDKNFYYNDSIEGGNSFQSQRITPFSRERRRDQLTPVLRKNYSSLTPVNNNSNQISQMNYQTLYNRNNIQSQGNQVNVQEKTFYNKNMISLENNPYQVENAYENNYNQSIQTLNNNQSTISTLAKTNNQNQIIKQNIANKSQNRTPIPRRITENQNEIRAASKSPLNNKRIVIVKDNLSPHQRIYVQQGHISNQILQTKINQNPYLQQQINEIEDVSQNQTFSDNFNKTQSINNFEEEISEQQEIQISQLKQQFDNIIQNCQIKPKKNKQQQRRYVHQSFI